MSIYKKYVANTALASCKQGVPRQDLHTSFDSSSLQAIASDATAVNDPAHENGGGRNKPQTAFTPFAEYNSGHEKRTFWRRYAWKLILGLFIPFSLQALDTTIIAGALPTIASDFNQVSQLNWIISAFSLCSAAFIPAWGQFADIFGRYTALQTSLLVMLIGSVICSATSTTLFPVFLVGRAFQGIGCSGISILTKVILADNVSLEENAKNNTIFTIIGGVGYGIGPVIGGYLSVVSWRWCFIIQVPAVVLGAALGHLFLYNELLGPQETNRTEANSETRVHGSFFHRVSSIDFGGQLLFLIGIGLIVLALTWANSYYPWSDTKVIAPLVIGAVTLIAFVIWEVQMIPGSDLANRFPGQKPLIPIKLLCTRNVGILFYINLTTGMAMYATFYFVSLYFSIVQDYGSDKAGAKLLYYLPGLAAGTYLAMFACNIYPRTTFHTLLLGSILEPVGITILAFVLQSQNLHLVYGMLALTGVGTGIRFMPGTLHAVGYHPDQIASVVSLMMLASALGGTLATIIMGNVLNSCLSRAGLSLSDSSGGTLHAIDGMDRVAGHILRDKTREGIALAFFVLSAFLWMGAVACLGLGNVDIGKKGEESSVTKRIYLLSLIRYGKDTAGQP